MSGEVLIDVRGLRSVFGSQVVHDGLDLDVRRGEILGVIGGSGAGKSVLLRSIVGLKDPDGGSIWFLGRDTTHLRAEQRRTIDRGFGLMFQDGALFSSLTVLENVELPLVEFHRLPRDLVRDIALLKIALTGLPPDAASKYPAQLSGGMRKRAGLARALALDPEILFLDEPTSGLDPVGAAAFDELILTLRNALNLTVFLVTHDLDSLYAICDRVAVLSNRRVVIADRLGAVESYPDPWIQACFCARGKRPFLAEPSEGVSDGNPR
jgi:phospholipid/cholesterol/gamma-HCH transport system ATP-binding protein